MASARLQRWALTLSSYTYTIRYKRGDNQGNADALSHVPLPEFPVTTPVPAETIASIECVLSIPLTAVKIKQQTDRDPILCKVKRYTQQGWPEQLKSQEAAELKPFFHRKSELSLEDGIILWGNRVVIPSCFQTRVLEVLHTTHIGISRMKSLACQFVWWPKLDIDIASMLQSCNACAVLGADPILTVLHPWEWPKQPWYRIHVDYAGPLYGKMYLILIDAHSKWMDVHITNGCTTATTIEKLQLSFSTFGLPQVLVSDNGPAFSSAEFQHYMKQNGINHVKTVPYHPASNGLAERAVKTFKSALKKLNTGTLQSRVNDFLFKYRITPHTTTGTSPAQLLFGRQLHSQLDLLLPSITDKVQRNQNLQKKTHDYHARDRQLRLDDLVLAKNHGQGPPWIPGKILKQSGAVTFMVELTDGTVIRRHLDQLKLNMTNPVESESEAFTNADVSIPDCTPSPEVATPKLRHSSRISRPPTRFSPDDY